jgi:predicted DsbA family dithiol-disulfide isomerase
MHPLLFSIRVFTGKLCSTFNAHRLLYRAWRLGGQKTQQALLDVIFKAYLGESAVISEKKVLADIAERAGVMGREQVSRFIILDPHPLIVDRLFIYLVTFIRL